MEHVETGAIVMKATTKVLACLLVMIVTGCEGRYIGGGWLQSANQIAEDKRHFTAHIAVADCAGDIVSETFGGSIHMNDTGVGIKFTCEITEVVFVGLVGFATGTVTNASGFRTSPDSCTVEVISTGSKPGSLDSISISTSGGDPAYSNSGVLEGGTRNSSKRRPSSAINSKTPQVARHSVG
jgi:hypothetical protein